LKSEDVVRLRLSDVRRAMEKLEKLNSPKVLLARVYLDLKVEKEVLEWVLS
jgi:hypothetical protein